LVTEFIAAFDASTPSRAAPLGVAAAPRHRRVSRTLTAPEAPVGGTRRRPHGEDESMNLDPPHFVWPPIDDAIEKAVVAQLHESVSIWDGGGIFAEFESRFAELHGRAHGCLFSSGTSALHAAYVALDLRPGDEVICPAYTFWATVTPLLWTGAVPVLCDSDEEGNLDVDQVAALITGRTKAVVVTHLWGVPAQVERLRLLCADAGLRLLEDCSHAHGATTGGRTVGTFGDIAVWSLQGHKTVNGGEGGILVCDDPEFFYRGLLFGHGGGRCLRELPPDHPLHEFAVTGAGLKQRAHPLAVAIAANLLERLPSILAGRQRVADMWTEAVAAFPSVRVPARGDRTFSWYALPLVLADRDARDRALHLLRVAGVVEANAPGSTGPLNLHPLFQSPAPFLGGTPLTPGLGYRPGMFPIAESLYDRTVVVPVFAGLNEREDVLAERYRDGFVEALTALG
jgi:perosamine synthetase